MANTPRGYPYPLGTDRVMDGDDAIHALASAVDDKLGGPMATGGVAMPALAAGATSTVAVTLPAGRFTEVPVIQLQTGHSRVSMNVNPGGTTTSFIVAIANWTGAGSGANSFNYLALAQVG